MRPHWRALWVVAIVIFFRVPALDAQTQGELDEQACDQFHKADVALNETYSKILKEYAKDQQFIAKLKTAQRAWLAFRDAELEALYPKDNKQAEYGTVYPMCHCSELQFLTEARTKELQRWIEGTIEGDVCAGSLRIAQRRQSEIENDATRKNVCAVSSSRLTVPGSHY
jgi:uncharacterized protein YecT (DUF1311 family)